VTDQIVARLDEFADIQRELETILQTLVLNDSTIIDALAQMLGAIQQVQLRAEKAQTRLEEKCAVVAKEMQGFALAVTHLDAERRQSPIVVSGDAQSETDPEIALLEYLQPFLDDATAIDVGANRGTVSERLLKSGYRVCAFEPFEASFQSLSKRLADYKDFRAFQIAIGDADGRRPLHVAEALTENSGHDPSLYHTLVPHPMPDRVRFGDTVEVSVRSLDSLRAEGLVPERVGALKIDTEGTDLAVIRGLGLLTPSVIVTEFWDGRHIFGQSGHGQLSETAGALLERGYYWYVVMYRPDDTGAISYYFNRSDTPANSWGNAVFFQDHALFAKAARWCEAVLNPTFFR
jgi:FkbM family methyltransferase